MYKIYVPNISKTNLGGGFSFLRNFRKGLEGKVEFVNTWQECDIVFVFSITTIDKNEIHEAINSGKKLLLRCDNIPRKSRNKRQSPAERLTEFGNKASAVVYQSQWCKDYAGYFITEKTIYVKSESMGPTEGLSSMPQGVKEIYTNSWIINNGVDPDIFNTRGKNSDGNTYLYINFNDNPNKRFDEALYWFDMEWRRNKEAKLIIAGNAPRIYLEHPEYNWDLPTNGKVEFVDVQHTPEQVSDLMRKCDYLLFPSFCEAYSNTALEALACGMEILYPNHIGGTLELLNNNKDKVKTIQEMCDEYIEVFNKIM